MLKNIKKVLFALILAFVAAFTFACGEDVTEANKENCKEFCDECPTCNDANTENCKEFCDECPTCPEINDETCEEFQDFIAPTDFLMEGDTVKVGSKVQVYLDEFEPENAYQGLLFESLDPSIATVDAEGYVTGVRPGTVTIKATSVLDPEVSQECEFEVVDALKELEVIAREIAYLKSQLPNFVTETYEFPKPWNETVQVKWFVNNVEAADGKLVVENLTADTKNQITVVVTYNGEEDQNTDSVIWSVVDANVNCFTRIQKAVAAADALVAEYAQAGVKVAEDIVLPATIFGCAMNWASSNTAVIGTDGKYTRPLDDKNVELSIAATYGDNMGKTSYKVVAKGYDAEEKSAAIMANMFGNLEGKEVNTSLVLPAYDNVFGAQLSYKSSDETIYANDGKLVAAPTEAKDVTFTVTIKYAISASANFEATKELKVKAVPATAASAKVEEWFASEAGKKYAAVAHTPYGTKAGNVLDLPTEGYAWNVEAVKLAVKNQAEDEDLYQVLTLAEGKVKLNAQYLRYTLVNLTGVYTAEDGSKANVNLFLNVGVADSPMVVYTGTWRSSAQKDSSLTEIQGKYDITSNVSYFDKKVGNITESYGSGYWSGYVMTATDANGQVWKSYLMELMTAYIVKGEDGNAQFDVKNLSGGNGGNWGVFFVNNTGEDVALEVGTYGTSSYTLADGSVIASVGSRNNLAMDGYAPGFVVAADGTVLHKSTDDKLEYNMENNKGYIGGKQYKAGDVIDAGLYAAMADEFKFDGETAKWEAVYTAAADFAFEVKADGTFKKVETTAEDGTVTVTYEAIAEGEEVTEKYAPKYAKGANIAAADYEALADADKANVTVTYKALAAVNFTVKNLVGDSSKGTLVHYLVIPAGGYAMSWKYQFYGVGSSVTLKAFTENSKVTVEKYDVHYLNSMDGEYAANYLANAQEILAAEDTAKNASAETYVNGARNYYAKLEGATKADVFAEADLVAAEKALAALVDKEIVDFLASEESVDQAAFADGLGKLNNRLAKYTAELTAQLTKKAEFDAKFEEYAKIDLTITYDYKGGYAQGYIYDSQKAYVMPLFLEDLYNHMVAVKAFQNKVVDGALVADDTLATPTLEEFKSLDYWNNNYVSTWNTTSILPWFLFTPYAAGETINENYHDLIEGSDRFFNTEKGQYWIALADWVNEATQYANGAGQDLWGRKGLPYVTYDLLAKQSYYNAGTMYKDPSGVVVTNSGTQIGTYRFAQYVVDSSLNANYKTYIPNKVWSTVFDRQTTQEEYGRQIYHCTDATVKLLDEPFKEGYKFLGWVFEDGSEAVITGSLFKDVTVYAKWAASVEELVEAEVGKDLTPVYYGDKGTSHPYMSATPAGETVDVQAANVGVGTVAVVVDGKLFPLPAKALIELGKDATADVTLTTKAELQVYGTDGYDQFSTGLAYDATTGTVTPKNSYGHGAMYFNAGQFNVSFNIQNTYGRDLNTADHGYQKVLFSYDAEKAAYVAKVVGTNGDLTMKPGEYLWCPMSAERFCTGLTTCNGTSGVAGVLADGVEAQIVNVKFAQDVAYIGVEFFNGAELVSGKYVEAEKATIEKPADLGKLGYKFKGWAKDPKATEAEEIPAETTESVKYYAVWEVLLEFEATVVDPANAGADLVTFATIAEALNATKEGGTVTVKAGVYDEALEIKRSVTIVGPNAGKAGTAERADEAVINAPITINAEGVVIDGVKLGTASNILFNAGKAKVTNVYSLASTFLKSDAINRTAVLYSSVAISDIEVSNSYFNIGDLTYLKGVWASAATVSNVTFSNNYFTHNGTDNTSISDCIAMYDTAGKLDFVGNHFVWVTDDWDLMIGYNSNQCTEINVIENTFDGVGDLYTCGFTIRKVPNGSVVNIIGNTFNTLSGTVIQSSYSLAGATFNIKYNAYMNCQYKESAWPTGVVANHENNYYAKDQLTATPDVDQLDSKEALDALYRDYAPRIQHFADEMVALFNATDIDGKVVTTQNEFTGTTHPNIKGVFANADTLAKYKWFLEYALAEITEASTANEVLESEYYTNTKEMLEKMIAGDTAAISGSYANGRTCFRQFIHKLINAENPAAGKGNTAYNSCVVDYASNPEKLAAFLELYKAYN